MTNEEREKAVAMAIEVFEHQIKRSEDVKCRRCDECDENPFEDYCIKDVAKWLSLALEALKQEPCEDAISRKAVLEYIENSCADLESNYENDQVYYTIKGMPSVRLQKKGSWIERFTEDERWLMCTECRQDSDKAFNFCPNCGADMRGEQK